MKKFIPFKKEIPFKTQIAEITSISLEHNIHKSGDSEISGNFIVSGEYRVTDTSTTVQDFRLDLPFDIEMSDIYNIDNVTIDIDDFYYEIKNMESLEVNITLLLDKIVEKPLIPEVEERAIPDSIDEECYEPEEPIEKKELVRDDVNEEEDIIKEPVKEETRENVVDEPVRDEVVTQNEIPILTEESKNIFSFTDDDDSSSYIVYIVRENDTVETIMEKYSVTIDKLREYNDLTEIKKGDKIIIPNV